MHTIIGRFILVDDVYQAISLAARDISIFTEGVRSQLVTWCLCQVKAITGLTKNHYTFPNTTQQSLIMYRLGALSVASTTMSYLASTTDVKIKILQSRRSEKEKKPKSQTWKENVQNCVLSLPAYLFKISKALEVRKASLCSTIWTVELMLKSYHYLIRIQQNSN